MAKVPRLNKTIIPRLADPGLVGTQSSGTLLQEAGGIARAGADLAGQELQRINQLKGLQEQTEMARRSAEFQNQAFGVVQENRKTFASDPAMGRKELTKSLRELNKNFAGDLSPVNQEVFNRSQEASIGRFDLSQRQWEIDQTQTNTRNNITAVGKSYLESAKLAGEAGDFDRLDVIAGDVSTLTQNASGVFEGKALQTFSQDLQDGVVENFSDALMFSQPEEFLSNLNDGFFDDVMTPEQVSDKKNEAEKFIQTKNEQAQFNRQMTFLRGNADVAKDVDKGTLTFNDLDELVAADAISPQFAETKRQEIINGKANVVTDPVTYGNLRAKVDRLLERKTVTETDRDGRITISEKILGADNLEASLALQQEIANQQASGQLKASDGNTLTKMLQIGISNTVAVDGINEALSINHYKDTSDAFEEQGLAGQELLDALRVYAVETERTGVDELNDQLAESKPSLLSKILPGQSAGTKEKIEKSDDLTSQIERLSKKNRQTVLKEIAVKRNPALSAFQGDIPNSVIERGVITKTLPGGDTAKDANIKIEVPFVRKLGADGRTYRVFEDGTFEVEG